MSRTAILSNEEGKALPYEWDALGMLAISEIYRNEVDKQFDGFIPPSFKFSQDWDIWLGEDENNKLFCMVDQKIEHNPDDTVNWDTKFSFPAGTNFYSHG